MRGDRAVARHDEPHRDSIPGLTIALARAPDGATRAQARGVTGRAGAFARVLGGCSPVIAADCSSNRDTTIALNRKEQFVAVGIVDLDRVVPPPSFLARNRALDEFAAQICELVHIQLDE